MPAPAIGASSALGFGGRFGTVVSAQPVGEAQDGRQLYALKVRTLERGEGAGPPPPGAVATPRPVQPARPPEAGSLRPTAAARGPDDLSASEKQAVDRLRQRDGQVRQEENAHAAVAGDLAGPISYVYQRGPDGRLYAVGGSVPIKAQSFSGDPQEAQRLGARIAAAAHAATNPSGADLAAARSGYGLQGEGDRAAFRVPPTGSLLDVSA